MRVVVYIAFIVTFICCKKAEERTCFKATGDITTIVEPVSIIQSIENKTTANISVYFDTLNQIEITGGENLISNYEINITNGNLTIEDNNQCNFLRNYSKKQVDIVIHTTNQLNAITNLASGDINIMDTLYTNRFDFFSSHNIASSKIPIIADSLFIKLETGAADVTISGEVNFAYLYSASNSFFFCRKLRAQKWQMLQQGTGDMFANCDGSIVSAEIHNIGNIYYQGVPVQTNVQEYGSGRFLKE